MASSIGAAFLGALQAGLSVLLVISYGVIAAQFQLLDDASSKKISSVCVRMFLPALLITKVGSELHLDTGIRYIPILIWAIFYNAASIGLGLVVVKLFKLPQWVTPAIAFNNTTSLPLLLIQSLESTGILESLTKTGETASDAVSRAQSYFLVCSIVGNCLTFAVGPRLIDAEEAPDKEDGVKQQDQDQSQHSDEEQHQQQEENNDEQTSLLPDRVQEVEQQIEEEARYLTLKRWRNLSSRSQSILSFLYDFFNAPLIGAVIGAIIGLTPPLHRAFFSLSADGGFLNAWLTSSLKNTGQLFVTLQVVVVGVKLSSSLRKMRRGDDSGNVPWSATLFVFFVRYLLWPVISIAVIWLLATRTSLLDDDPVLWFAMMLMPTGPPAMKLIAMADVNNASEAEKMSISKLLTIAYIVSPVLAVTVVGALKASQAAMQAETL